MRAGAKQPNPGIGSAYMQPMPGRNPPLRLGTQRVAPLAIFAKSRAKQRGGKWHADPDREVPKYDFGRLIDLTYAEMVAIAQHGRPVPVVMAGGLRASRNR